MVPIIFISCLGIIVYSNTFLCSFHFDDNPFIVDDFFIRNIHHLQTIWNYYPCRFFTFLSYAVNYHYCRLDVLGYHLFNIAVHLGSAILVWWLALLTFSCPGMKEDRISRHGNVLALLAGLVFVSHPVQTESVTYIYQRAASMAALFYLASLCFYIKSRLSPVGHGTLYYFCSLTAAIMAMLTKENTVTLPLMILLYEICFLKTPKSLNWKYLSPFLLTLFIIPLTMLLTRSVMFQELRDIIRGPHGISPVHYLLTEFRVMVTYVRLVFLPLNQNLDYDYPIAKSIFELPVLLSFLFLMMVLVIAGRLFSKYRIISFSIFWFFLALLPESSFLPETDVLYEHRLYLPLVGYSIFLVSGVYYLLGENKLKRILMVLVMIIACNSLLTYQRNKVWRDDFTLWDDAVRKSPHKARPYGDRGNVYFQQGHLTQALADFNKAIAINPNDPLAYNNRGSVYENQGNFTQALADFNKAIAINPLYTEAYDNRGVLYARHGDFTRALIDFDKALAINPKFSEAYNNRGIIYYNQNDFTQALINFNEAIEINPYHTEAYANRGLIFEKQGNFTQAIADFNKAIEINPENEKSYRHQAIAYFQLKEYDKAWKDVEKIKKLGNTVNPELFDLLKNASGSHQ